MFENLCSPLITIMFLHSNCVVIQEATSGRDDLPMLTTVKTEMSDGWNDDDNTVTARPTAYQRLLEVMMKKEVRYSLIAFLP